MATSLRNLPEQMWLGDWLNWRRDPSRNHRLVHPDLLPYWRLPGPNPMMPDPASCSDSWVCRKRARLVPVGVPIAERLTCRWDSEVAVKVTAEVPKWSRFVASAGSAAEAYHPALRGISARDLTDIHRSEVLNRIHSWSYPIRRGSWAIPTVRRNWEKKRKWKKKKKKLDQKFGAEFLLD